MDYCDKYFVGEEKMHTGIPNGTVFVTSAAAKDKELSDFRAEALAIWQQKKGAEQKLATNETDAVIEIVGNIPDDFKNEDQDPCKELAKLKARVKRILEDQKGFTEQIQERDILRAKGVTDILSTDTTAIKEQFSKAQTALQSITFALIAGLLKNSLTAIMTALNKQPPPAPRVVERLKAKLSLLEALMIKALEVMAAAHKNFTEQVDSVAESVIGDQLFKLDKASQNQALIVELQQQVLTLRAELQQAKQALLKAADLDEVKQLRQENAKLQEEMERQTNVSLISRATMRSVMIPTSSQGRNIADDKRKMESHWCPARVALLDWCVKVAFPSGTTDAPASVAQLATAHAAIVAKPKLSDVKRARLIVIANQLIQGGDITAGCLNLFALKISQPPFPFQMQTIKINDTAAMMQVPVLTQAEVAPKRDDFLELYDEKSLIDAVLRKEKPVDLLLLAKYYDKFTHLANMAINQTGWLRQGLADEQTYELSRAKAEQLKGVLLYFGVDVTQRTAVNHPFMSSRKVTTWEAQVATMQKELANAYAKPDDSGIAALRKRLDSAGSGLDPVATPVRSGGPSMNLAVIAES